MIKGKKFTHWVREIKWKKYLMKLCLTHLYKAKKTHAHRATFRVYQKLFLRLKLCLCVFSLFHRKWSIYNSRFLKGTKRDGEVPMDDAQFTPVWEEEAVVRWVVCPLNNSLPFF